MSMELPLAAALPRPATCLAAGWPHCSSMQRRIPSYSSSRFLVMRRLSVQSNSSCRKLQDRGQQPGALASASNYNIKESSSSRDDSRHDDEQSGRSRLISKHPLPPEKQEIFRSLDEWAEEKLLPFLKPVEKCWQPQDFLPVPRSMSPASSEEFIHDVREIQERAAGIPDELYVCLVGNMITEEALPTYQSLLNTFHGVNDVSGASPTAWARWIRAWSAEENRHGDLLNKYLYLSGRLDMRQVEKTVQYLIGAGMDIGGDNNAFCGIIYGCFQERATFISHGNTAGHAKKHGDAMLAKICGLVAADEKRHAAAYTTLMSKLFEVDPDESVRALAHMMRMRVTMPAHLMFDGCDRDLFRHFSAVGQRIGVYTAWDYGDMLELFLREWEVESMVVGLSSEGRRAQDYVCSLPGVIRKMAERSNAHDQKKESRYLPFSWIFNKRVLV